MARLTAEQRNRMPDSTFAVPERRAYPINDKAHARAALRLIGYAHSADEKARIRAKARRMLASARGGQPMEYNTGGKKCAVGGQPMGYSTGGSMAKLYAKSKGSPSTETPINCNMGGMLMRRPMRKGRGLRSY
jgi:hypothetical protein